MITGGKSLFWIIFSRLISIIAFFLLVATINYMSDYITNPTFGAIAVFLDANMMFVVLIAVLFLIAEIFDALRFPFNLPAPLFNSLGAVSLISFIFAIVALVDTITDKDFSSALIWLTPFIYPLVFIIILILGYLSIFAERRAAEAGKDETDEAFEHWKDRHAHPDEKTWGDVGSEFRHLVFDIVAVLRNSVRKEPKEEKKEEPQKKD